MRRYLTKDGDSYVMSKVRRSVSLAASGIPLDDISTFIDISVQELRDLADEAEKRMKNLNKDRPKKRGLKGPVPLVISRIDSDTHLFITSGKLPKLKDRPKGQFRKLLSAATYPERFHIDGPEIVDVQLSEKKAKGKKAQYTITYTIKDPKKKLKKKKKCALRAKTKRSKKTT